MAALALAEFLIRFPELAIHGEPQLQWALDASARVCSEEIWGASHEDGIAFHAAHLIAMRAREIGSQVGQPVAGSGKGTDATFYGQMFENLRATLPVCGFAI